MSDLKNLIREIAQEILDEMTGTGAVAGYQTPFAFSGKGDGEKKKLAARSIPGGQVVGEEITDDVEVGDALPTIRRGLNENNQMTSSPAMQVGMKSGMTEKEILSQAYDNLFAVNMKVTNGDKRRAKVRTQNRMWYMDDGDYCIDVLSDYQTKFGPIKYDKQPVSEGRYANFKSSNVMKNHAKVSYGLREAKKVLSEVEFLVGICERLKLETNVDQSQLWKRSKQDIKEVHSRLKNIAKKINRIAQ
jgi:hypothetical protein